MPARSKKVNDEKWMPYYQSPRKRAGGTSSRNEVSWIARATGVTSKGDNPLYYCGVSINGVLVTPATSCTRGGQPASWGLGLHHLFRGIHVPILRRDKVCPWTSDGRDIRGNPRKQRPQEGAPPERGLPRLPSLQRDKIVERLGNGHCHSCKVRKSQEQKNTFWYSESTINFTYQRIHYEALDFLYISPSHFEESQNGNQSVIEDDEDSMPETYVICQFVSVDTPSSPAQLNPYDVSITVRRFYRPENFNAMDALPLRHPYGLLKLGRTNVDKLESFVVNPLICEVNRGFTVPECVLFFLGFSCFARMAVALAQSYGFNF
nr:DNA cytosine-5-methyltransferase [Ipomoea batatas]